MPHLEECMEARIKMFGGLTSEYIKTSIGNLRIAEDSISAVVLFLIMVILFDATYHIVKKGPLVSRLWGIIIGLFPLFLWKSLGAIRRIFLEKSHELYGPLHDFGEIMESVSALFILASLVYFYLLVKAKR